MTKEVAVLMGGSSVEREVSLDSGRACAAALREAGYKVREVEVGGDIGALLKGLSPRPDAVFNALHGRWGEDGCVQGLLELMAIPYSHSGVLASALAMNKVMAKRVVAMEGIISPEGKVVRVEDLLREDVLERPYVVKPICEGSSVGVRIVQPGDNEPPLRADQWSSGDEVLVERFIPGRELTVAVMGGKPLAVTEMRPKMGFYDYRAKYTDGVTEHILPAPIPEAITDQALSAAAAAHAALGCRGVSRSDFRYDDSDDGDGRLYYLETNTQPGMTALSLVPEQASHLGISFPELCSWMVEHAACDFLRSKKTPNRRNRGLTVASDSRRRGQAAKRPAGTARKRTAAKKTGRRRAPAFLSRRQVFRLALSLGLLACLSGTAWLWQSGWFHYQTARLVEGGYQLTAKAGLKVEDLQVTGRQRTDTEKILAVMNIERGLPILRLDPDALREKLLALPWIKEAVVTRQLPDIVALHLTERQPLAIWQVNGKFSLIDEDGRVIPGMDVRPFATLPLVVGEGARQEAPRLLAMLQNEPALKQRVTAAVWVGGRRWQLQLDGDIDVHLPESDPAAAWTQLASVEREHGLLKRGVVTIDLRLPDRLLVRTAPADAGAAKNEENGENT